MKDGEEFDRHYRAFYAVMEKLSRDDLFVVAQPFDVSYQMQDDIYDPDGKKQYIEGIYNTLREYRRQQKNYQLAREAYCALKRNIG